VTGLGPSAADHADAARLAEEAGALLLELRGRIGAEAAEVVKDEGDRRSHNLLVERLAHLHPADGVLSEEGADDQARLAAERVWIVDPLDGTREFGEPPRDDWAVHVALVIDHVAVAGAVALPGRGLVLSTGTPPVLPPTGPRIRLAVSRTRPPAAAELLARVLDAELVPMGSAGAKAMAVVLGEVEVYAHSGGQYEWDSAAPVAVAEAAGLHCTRLDGAPLRYNQPNPWLPDLLICRPELAERVLGALR
jgi:3'(2'), 5'-bisphosphate nucleotidase